MTEAKRIHAERLSNLAMVAGGEKSITKVIDDGVVKEWVGFGWVDLRAATAEDRKTLPVVTRTKGRSA